jgi:hypothetical protein
VKHNVVLNAGGRVVWDSEPSVGSKHDFSLVKEEKGVGCNLTIKQFFNPGRGESLSIMGDSGFQGLAKMVPGSVIPKRKPVGGELDDDDEAENRNIAHDREHGHRWSCGHETVCM